MPCRKDHITRTIRYTVAALALDSAALPAQRAFEPADLFRIERVGAVTWSAEHRRAAVEISRPGRWIGSIPTTRLTLVDATTGALRTISPASPAFVAFFGAAWSPNGRRLLFLSVDTNAVVRPWLWDAKTGAARLLPGLDLHDGLLDAPVALWTDDDHAVLMLRDTATARDGPLYFRITRGRNSADAWRRARDGQVAAVSVVESRGPQRTRATRIVSVDVTSGAVRVLATGALHRPRLSADRRTLTFLRETPDITSAAASSFLGSEAHGEKAYDRVNWGDDVVHIDSRSGAPVAAPPPSAQPAAGASPALRVVDDRSTGTRLVLARDGKPDVEVWRGNTWRRDVAEGRAEAVSYTSATGTALTGWLLYPPNHTPGRKLPIVTIVYPSAVFGQRVPSSFDLLNANFEHPQLFAARGYGVLLPSMPEPEKPLEANGIDSLPGCVLPLLDTLVARGIADADRIAVLGQSAGGWATISLITQTNRFRTAIASGSYANLESLYGTFYGQYRHGDGGPPQRSQMLRILQFERGYWAANAPPWEAPERYRRNSPLWQIARVNTPLMLVHGEIDFIPIQQAEEVFTALYRQDKRVRLVRYAGEEHTITARANVLDLWRQFDAWLGETMPARE